MEPGNSEVSVNVGHAAEAHRSSIFSRVSSAAERVKDTASRGKEAISQKINDVRLGIAGVTAGTALMLAACGGEAHVSPSVVPESTPTPPAAGEQINAMPTQGVVSASESQQAAIAQDNVEFGNEKYSEPEIVNGPDGRSQLLMVTNRATGQKELWLSKDQGQTKERVLVRVEEAIWAPYLTDGQPTAFAAVYTKQNPSDPDHPIWHTVLYKNGIPAVDKEIAAQFNMDITALKKDVPSMRDHPGDTMKLFGWKQGEDGSTGLNLYSLFGGKTQDGSYFIAGRQIAELKAP